MFTFKDSVRPSASTVSQASILSRLSRPSPNLFQGRCCLGPAMVVKVLVFLGNQLLHTVPLILPYGCHFLRPQGIASQDVTDPLALYLAQLLSKQRQLKDLLLD